MVSKHNIYYKELLNVRKVDVNMKSYIVEGGHCLKGEVSVSGSKNAALPIIAATLLNRGISTLYHVPKIHDTKIMLEILEILGCQIHINSDKIVIDSSKVDRYEIPECLMREMRSSVILAGAIIGRYKRARFSYPGGCDIGARPIDLHLEAFKKMGIEIEEESGFIHCSCDKITGAEIALDFPSVGATENIILAAVLAEGKTVIKNAAMEPEIIDLQNFLNEMGACVSGAGTKEIEIIGVSELHQVTYKVMPDRIEAGTLLCAAAITGGDVVIKEVNTDHLTPVIHKLEECGCEFQIFPEELYIKAPQRLKAVDIKTMPYPGFPTDMQSIFSSILTNAKGTSVIIENIFENRYKYTSELKRMGAKITIEGKTVVIKGVKKLSGTSVNSTDLRGGAALVIAGLVAKGETKINHIEYILRGYENLDEKLRKLGANIRKEEGE